MIPFPTELRPRLPTIVGNVDYLTLCQRLEQIERLLQAGGLEAHFVEQVFAATNNVRGWWSQEIEGRTDKLGAEFEFHYKDLHRSTQKITELVPGKKVVWHVTDAHINFVNNKTEWKGTDIVFEISRKGDKTELRFTHIGLIPTIQCYGDCSGAWGYYIHESLLKLITTGKGQPAVKEDEAELVSHG
jgi:hypothetical protein